MSQLVTIIQNPGTESEIKRSLPIEIFKKQVAAAQEFLGPAYEGYVTPEEVTLAEGVIGGTAFFNHKQVQSIKKRVAEIKEAEIPPLYIPGMGSAVEGSTYPVLDVLIQLPTGYLFKSFTRQHAQGRRRRGADRGWANIHPSTRGNIAVFRTVAYDGDHLSPHIVRDIQDYLSQRDFGSEAERAVATGDHLKLKFLEERLRGVVPLEREYAEFDPSDPINFMGKRFWHTKYRPEDRVRVVQEYIKRLSEGEIGLNSEHLKRLEVVFPEVVSTSDIKRSRRMQRAEEEVERNKARMEEHIVSGNFIGMPQVVLTDPRYDVAGYTRELYAHVERECQRVMNEDPMRIMEPIKNLHAEFDVLFPLLHIEPYRDAITARRIEVLERMGTQEFEGHFGLHQRTASIGHRDYVDNNPMDQRFRDLLAARYAELRV